MRSLGIVRRLDQLGRLVIPKETRRAFNLNEREPVEIFTDEDKIIINAKTITARKYKLEQKFKT